MCPCFINEATEAKWDLCLGFQDAVFDLGHTQGSFTLPNIYYIMAT